MEGHWKFRGGGGSRKPKFLKESMELNWNFQRGGEIQTKMPSMGGVWIFSGTIHYTFYCHFLFKELGRQRYMYASQHITDDDTSMVSVR